MRRVDPRGNDRTFAGGGDPDTLGDGGPATAATLKQPRGLALAADGTLYIAEAGRDRVRRIAPDGRISTVAGGAPRSATAGPRPSLAAARPTSRSTPRARSTSPTPATTACCKVTAAGVIDTVAGNGEPGTTGDGGSATAAEIGQPYGVDVGRDGTVYFSDRLHHVVRRVARTARSARSPARAAAAARATAAPRSRRS